MNARLRIRFVVLIALIGVFIWQRSRRLERLEEERQVATAETASHPASLVFAAPASQPTSIAANLPLALDSPQSTLSTQIGLLQTNDYDTFAKTMLPAVTRQQFDACRERMRAVKIYPDWEMAKEAQRDGHRVLRVSIFGKSYTDFHFIDGKVLTGQVWCLPPG